MRSLSFIENALIEDLDEWRVSRRIPLIILNITRHASEDARHDYVALNYANIPKW